MSRQRRPGDRKFSNNYYPCCAKTKSSPLLIKIHCLRQQWQAQWDRSEARGSSSLKRGVYDPWHFLWFYISLCGWVLQFINQSNPELSVGAVTSGWVTVLTWLGLVECAQIILCIQSNTTCPCLCLLCRHCEWKWMEHSYNLCRARLSTVKWNIGPIPGYPPSCL